MAWRNSNYTVGEIKALISPVVGVAAEDISGIVLVIVSEDPQTKRMIALSSGDSAYDRIALLSAAITNEAMGAPREGQ